MKNSLEQNNQKLLNEIFTLNQRLTESILLVSELRSKRERDQELLLQESSRKSQLEQSFIVLERENAELKNIIHSTSHSLSSVCTPPPPLPLCPSSLFAFFSSFPSVLLPSPVLPPSLAFSFPSSLHFSLFPFYSFSGNSLWLQEAPNYLFFCGGHCTLPL